MSETSIDLSECDREPIHVPGSIQPHGVLLVAERHSQRILQAAGETERMLGRSIDTILDDTLGAVLGSQAAALVASAQPASEPVHLGSVAITGAELCLTAHDREDVRILEIEPSSPLPQSTAEVMAQARKTAGLFARARTSAELLQRAACEARHLTGFDRVMIYRFLGDGSGSVAAEDRADSLPAFLNHRYPASDIPKQARELYLRNPIRVIPDVKYTPAPLVPPLHPATGASLDMSECTLRSVSPIHVQYLKNMHVAASMSVSIVVDGALWGLMAFHHRTPKLVPYELREMCRHLGELLSQQIKAREDAEAHRQMLDLAARREKLSAILSRASSIGQALLEHLPELGGALPADGAAIVLGDKSAVTQRAPSQTQVRELVAWLLDGAQSDVFETSSLVRHYAPAASYAREASGLIAAIVSRAEPLVLLWFRAEQLETINWAGNPHKPVEPGAPFGKLNPRKSFEIWKETVHNRSEPWSTVEVDAASALGGSVYELLQTQKLREVNERLLGTLSEKEVLLRQKDLLMQEVNHRVQNSLQLVNAMLALQAQEAGDAGLRAQFDLASDRIMAIAMVHRRLWQADHIQSVDFTFYMQELRDGVIETWGPEWRGQVTVHGQPFLVPTDIAVVLALVVIELLMNAVKYAYGGRPGPIEVRIEQAPLDLRVIVKDQGVGMAAGNGGQGLGSRLTRGLIDQLDGELKVDSSAQGTSIALGVPLAASPLGEVQ